jgi:hypothetical protein
VVGALADSAGVVCPAAVGLAAVGSEVINGSGKND